MVYEAEILDIKPNALDGDRIVDAFVKVRVDGMEFWSFVYEWKSKKWSMSFVGKRKSLRFVFLDDILEPSDTREKSIIPVENRRKPCDYVITGEIKKTKPHATIPRKERIEVDFGITIDFSGIHDAGRFSVSDYVKAKGRLDAHLIDEANE